MTDIMKVGLVVFALLVGYTLSRLFMFIELMAMSSKLLKKLGELREQKRWAAWEDIHEIEDIVSTKVDKHFWRMLIGAFLALIGLPVFCGLSQTWKKQMNEAYQRGLHDAQAQQEVQNGECPPD